MKKFLLLFLFFTGAIQAQIVNIPDPVFKAYLIAQGYDTNVDGDIQNLEAQTILSISITNLDVTDLTGIQSFINLNDLTLENSLITSLDLSGLTSLLTLDIINNSLLTTLNLTGLSNVYNVTGNHNPLLSILILTGMTDLYYLDCSYSSLTSLDLTGLVSLGILFFHHSEVSSINFSEAPNLSHIECNYTLLSIIDITDNPQVIDVYCSYCPMLEIALVKNGNNGLSTFGFNDSDNLKYICAIEQLITFFAENYPNAEVNSYCSFTLPGNTNLIGGNIIFDSNSNGCDVLDPNQEFIKLTMSSGQNQYSVFTSLDGDFSNYFNQFGTFSLNLAIENASLFTVTPPFASAVFQNTNNNSFTQDFCITANGVQPDLEVVISPLTNARPGFDAQYMITYRNKGNQILSGAVGFAYEDALLDFVASDTAPDLQSTGMLNWNFANLYPFESRSVTVTLNVNSPMETPAVNIDDQLNFSATVSPITGDILPLDNEFLFKQTVVGSFDPNDITCLEGANVSPTQIGNYLHYVINFENTGTAPAENIVVKDIIDTTKFEISSLQVMDSSHPMQTRITNDKAEFIFEGINLGASEHGNLVFKIKTKNTLVTGNTVTNKADIYFDYNFPIETNLASTTFSVLGIEAIETQNTVSVYPNPTKNKVNIKSIATVNSIQLFDIQGRMLQVQSSETSSIDLSEYPSGVYFLKIFTANEIITEKIVKQ